MRRILILMLPLTLAACGQAPEQAAPAAAEPAPPRLDFAAKAPIPARLDLLSAAEGGREYPIAGAWRGEFAFDGGKSLRCAIDRGGLGELAPGSSHEVHLVCAGSLALPDDGRRGFRVMEDGRAIGWGVVLP